MNKIDDYTDKNPLMDIKVEIGGQVIEFNTVEELKFKFADMEQKLELLPSRIGFINGISESMRDLEAQSRNELKRTRENTWVGIKKNQKDENDKPYSDKRVDMMLSGDAEIEEIEREILRAASNVRRLDGFLHDLRGMKIAIETILKTRII